MSAPQMLRTNAHAEIAAQTLANAGTLAGKGDTSTEGAGKAMRTPAIVSNATAFWSAARTWPRTIARTCLRSSCCIATPDCINLTFAARKLISIVARLDHG